MLQRLRDLIWLHVELSAHCRYFIFRALYKRARVHCAFYNRFMFSVVFRFWPLVGRAGCCFSFLPDGRSLL